MPTASVIRNDKNYRERLLRTNDGYSGSRYYLVKDATSLANALTATGLPAVGASWGDGLTALAANTHEPVREAGTGNYHVKVSYTESRSTELVIPQDGLSVTTEVLVERTSETVYYDINGVDKLSDQGVQKLQIAVAFRIRTFYAALPDLNTFMALANEPKVNNAGVVIRNLYGSGQNISVAAGQLLYAGFQPGRQGELYYVDHDVLWRASWKYRKTQIASDLKGNAIYDEKNLYETASFVAPFATP